MSDTEVLKRIIRERGPIPTVRVSSAQASGIAKRYPYWGASRGEIRLRKSDGELTVVPVQRASSDRRSERLAEADADAIADREGRIFVQKIGELDPITAKWVLKNISYELGEGC